jgi:phosphoglycolate phosphatase
MKIPLFDIDGTLFKEENPIHMQAHDFAFEKVHKIKNAFSNCARQQKGGRTFKKAVFDILAEYGLTPKEIEEKFKDTKNELINYFLKECKQDSFTVFPGVKKLLLRLKGMNVPMGILTGNVEKIAWRKLDAAGIKDFFNFGAFGDDTYKRSDLVFMAKKAADKKFKTDFPLKNFVIIGDTPRDIQCAREMGIKVIAVPTGHFSFNELEQLSPDLLIESLEEQKKFLDFLQKD